MQACLGAKNGEESTFNHCASPVKPVPVGLSGRNDRESSLLLCRGLVKPAKASLRRQESSIKQFSPLPCRPVSVAGMIKKAAFPTVKLL